jgi:SNF2 family DNA or RNA helicase
MWYEQLLPEQRDAADFVIKNKTVALFCQQRTGKTYISMAVLEKVSFSLALVVAPRTAVDAVWVKALEKSDCQLCLTLEETREALKARGARQKVVLGVSWQYFVKIAKRAAKLPFQVLIIDESQGLKSRNSHQSRAARRFRDVGQYRLALSGTPIDESPIDVWAQMRFVNHKVLGEDWTRFAEEYCKRGGFMGYQWVFREERKEALLHRLNPYIYRLTIGFMKLPPVEIHLWPVCLLGSQDAIYQAMTEEGYAQVNGNEITAPLPVTKLVKQEQITGGCVIDDEDNVIRTGKAKERKLQSIISKLTRPVVIFCQFLHEIELIRDVLGPAFPETRVLHGKIKGKERVGLLQDFGEGRVDALISQLRTGGVAIDLTRSCELVLYSINHSFIDYEQVIFRLRGMNQKQKLRVHIIYAVDTVDEEKIAVIEHKKSEVYRIVSHFERST